MSYNHITNQAKRLSFLTLLTLFFLCVTFQGFGQTTIGFFDAEEYNTNGQYFEDQVVTDLISILDSLLQTPEVQEDFSINCRVHFWRFFNRLAKGKTNKDQDVVIRDYLLGLKEKHKEHAKRIDQQLYQFDNLIIGRQAPDIEGKDMYAKPFKLSDYKGKIIVLVFTGHWCGPCRGEYPYQRELLEKMEGKPVVLLGVNSDSDREEALKAKKDEKLDYRAWWAGWDMAGKDPRKGPIPDRWNIVGWPSIFIIDKDGIIRFRSTRREKMIEAVESLL